MLKLDQTTLGNTTWYQRLKKVVSQPFVGVLLLCFAQLGLLVNFHISISKWIKFEIIPKDLIYFYAITLLSTLFFVLYLVPKVFLKRLYIQFSIIFIAWYLYVFTPLTVSYYRYTSTPETSPLVDLGFKDFGRMTVETYDKQGIWGLFTTFDFAYIISIDFVYNFGIVFLYCFIKFYLVDSIKKARIDNLKTELEITYLKQQINPHFLFNSLNNIYGFVMKKDPKAEETIEKLRALLAFSNLQEKQQFIPLNQEVSSILNIIELEKIRYSKGLNLVHNLEENRNLDLKIAPFILQTFVENAFKHGASTDVDKPTIIIKLSTIKNKMHFEITNSIPKVYSKKAQEGIGLKNTLRRIELLYPTAKMNINQTTDSYVVQLSLSLEK